MLFGQSLQPKDQYTPHVTNAKFVYIGIQQKNLLDHMPTQCQIIYKLTLALAAFFIRHQHRG